MLPVARLQCGGAGQLGGGVAGEECVCVRDELLIRKILRNLRQQMMNTGHVTLTVLHLPLTIQHYLKPRRPIARVRTHHRRRNKGRKMEGKEKWKGREGKREEKWKGRRKGGRKEKLFH